MGSFGRRLRFDPTTMSGSATWISGRLSAVSLWIAGLAPGGRKVHVPFRRSFLRGSIGLMASPRQRRCVWRFAAAEWRPRAAKCLEQRGLRSRFGCRTKCGSLGWWFRIWNWSKDCRSICPAFFQLSHPKRPEPPTRKRRRAWPFPSFRGRLKLRPPAPRRSTPTPSPSPNCSPPPLRR